MKTLVTSVLFMAISTVACAQAKIKFDNTTVEYHNVKPGSDGARSFTFTNTGNKPLIIKKVTSTSQHLTVSPSKKRIAPGKTGKINIDYDTRVKGPIRRTVTVFSNAENAPIKALKVKGYVAKDQKEQ